MKALCWQGKKDLRCEEVPDPIIEAPRDAIVEVTSCAICGSDLHLWDGLVPTMCKGDVMGHEMMGRIVDVGKEANGSGGGLKVGDRVVVPFTIVCGECEQCRKGNYSVCRRTNRNAALGDAFFGHHTAGIFGYSHITGGYAGGQAEYLRVPYADTTLIKVPEGPSDETLLFLGDIFPTGWQAAWQCDIQPTDTVAVWGCGPVGQFALRAARMLGAERVIAIDDVPERLVMAQEGGAETIDRSQVNVLAQLNEMTRGEGPEKCIDAVGMEAHGPTPALEMIDRVMTGLKMETERPTAVREAIMACQVGGTVSIAGVYGGLANMIPLGALMNKALTIRTGQTHVQRWAKELLQRIENEEIDPAVIVTHVESLARGPEMYRKFRDKEDGCVKVVLKPR
ncbi:zinc-dependent alcohol dehydrogenase [Phenylobacterium sp.]|uniref:zinc-dependent alcohol dehydrogenase n=1 Tax=Phenylobacterium sp. TaxID=1871053 RepID=UPI0008D75B1F|nr:zinc-dependent alcohol dehydrogenase [Phenylobacterium sp.]MBA4792660.1 glutathione-dependent formaldehyde dehydrogenase [Phenylobacterium sp.]OHB34844.1 MAG: glutathione-dependent formaldehyde dehydrogenase [Phenylobacterium sp. RIFCSPHIGHO2_01_FULL_70_10]